MVTTTAEEENGYEVSTFIKSVKSFIGLSEVLRVYWHRESHQSVSRKIVGENRVEMDMATVDQIMKDTGKSKDEAIASQKTAIIEEICHNKLDKDHTPEVYVCVRKTVDEHLEPGEKLAVIKKLDLLKQHCINETPSSLVKPIPLYNSLPIRGTP